MIDEEAAQVTGLGCSEMAKSNDEETYETFLEERWKAGHMGSADKMRMMEEFRALRAQRKASTSALYAAIAAVFSAAFAAASVIIPDPLEVNSVRASFPDAVQRDSGAPQIRDRNRLRSM